MTAWEAAVAAYPAEFQAVYPTRQDIPKGSQVGNYLADLPAVDGALQEHRPASSFSMRMIHKKSGGALAQRVIQQANEKMKAVHNLKAVLGQASGTPRPYEVSSAPPILLFSSCSPVFTACDEC